jgi:hypothetical protein
MRGAQLTRRRGAEASGVTGHTTSRALHKRKEEKRRKGQEERE